MDGADSAEVALAAFARDLVEEIAAGRALELAQVRPHLRFEHGREEQVRGYSDSRQSAGWIPEPDWLAGQQQWEKAGEAAWKAHEAARGLGAPPEQGIPEPLKGASAVHPQLHGKHVTLPGDTLSGHAHAHVPRPFEVKAPTVTDVALGEAHSALAAHQHAALQQISALQRQAQAQQTGIPEPGNYAPLTDEQYAAHVDAVEHAIDHAYQQGMATNRTETMHGNRNLYTPERAAIHKEIVGQHLAKAVNVPSEGRGLVMGGLGGAGKSTVLKNNPSIDISKYAVVNSDDIKEELARRGLVPPVEGLSPMEASSLVHQESRHVANLVSRALMRRHKNVAFDITMKGTQDTQDRLDWFAHHGYRDVHGIFVDVPTETAVERNMARHRKGLEQYRQGKGLGGRYVPSYIIRQSEYAPGKTINRATFDQLRPQFTGSQLWDNSGAAPKLIDQTGGEPAGSGITSVEDLIKQTEAKQAKALDTEPAAAAAEHGGAGHG